MKLICAGLPKTGTKTMAKALEILGYRNCDSAMQCFVYLDEFYDLVFQGKMPDFKALFKEFDSCTDIPSSFFFEEILEAFPDAKVVLLVREEESWLKSLSGQLHQADSILRRYFLFRYLSPTFNKLLRLAGEMHCATVGSVNPEATEIFRKNYRMHSERVKATVPKEQLLVYSVTQGWTPLCDFLGCAVPAGPFPHENKLGAFGKTSKEIQITGKNRNEVKMLKEVGIRLGFLACVIGCVIYATVLK